MCVCVVVVGGGGGIEFEEGSGNKKAFHFNKG